LTKEKLKHKLDHFKWETWEKLLLFQFIPGCSPSEFLFTIRESTYTGFLSCLEKTQCSIILLLLGHS